MRNSRIAAVSGAVYVILIMVGNGLATGNGDPQSGQAILDHLHAGRTPAETVGVVMEVLSFAALIVFLGYLYRVLRRAEGLEGWGAATALGAGLVTAAVKLAGAASGAAALLHRDVLSPELARTLDDLGTGSFVVSGYLSGIFVAAAAGSAFATCVLPRWLSVGGLVVGTLTIAAGTAGVLDPAGYVPVPFLLGLVWVLVTSVVLTVRAARTAGTTAHGATTAVPAGVRATA